MQTIIIGQGLAGSVLAWELHRRGHSVKVVDDGRQTSASMVAAGMVNPVQGQRLNLAWRVEECLPASRAFFAEAARKFGREFFRPAPILRLLDNEHEREFLDKRREDERFAPFLGEEPSPSQSRNLNDEYGGVFINQSGYVEVGPLLESLADYYRAEGILHHADFVHEELEIAEQGVRWRDLAAERIIFAEGWRILENPWFREFNFQPNKGEILTLGSDREFPEHPINRGKWIIPKDNGTVWTGSTYGRGQTDADITHEARDEIMTKVAQTLPDHELNVIGHRAGVRCATGDHIPRAGFHPDHPRVGVFNGFGSKGNVFIPWLAARFAENITAGVPLPEDCDFRQRPPRRKG